MTKHPFLLWVRQQNVILLVCFWYNLSMLIEKGLSAVINKFINLKTYLGILSFEVQATQVFWPFCN